jgi:dienelactone hydrolase
MKALLAALLLSFPTLCALASLLLLTVSVGLGAYLSWELSTPRATGPEPIATPSSGDLAAPRATLAALATQVAALSPVAGAPAPPPAPVQPAPFFLPAPIPHPMADYTIEGLRARPYPGGTLRVRSVLTTTHTFTRYYVDYPSDGLTITGIMQIPPGAGPFPVIILNHGYIPRDSYWSGADTWNAAAYLNQRGYLTIAPDFRSWGESDVGVSLLSTGQVIDALSLVSSLPSVAQADFNRVGMWGHSMGGGVVSKAMTVDPRIKAAVLYAPVSGDDAQVLARWGSGCRPGPSGELGERCAGAEVLTGDMDQRLYLAYSAVVSDRGFLYQTSPINYLEWVAAPVQIHIGTADTRTPPEWSAALYEALQAAGKEVEYFTYAGQGHALQGKDWRLFMERSADFYDRWLAPE